MKYLARMAFKNLFRHKLRTFVSIIAIAFAVMIVVFARGFIVGMVDSVSADHIQYNSGHIKVINQEYQQQERLLPLNHPVDGFKGQDLAGMITALEQLDDVEMAIPRVKFGAMASTGEEMVTMMGWGVNPGQEVQFTDIENYLVEGRMAQPGKREVVMGTTLLEELNKQVGDKVTILFNTSFGSLKGVTFKIAGRVASGIKVLDEIVFYLPLDQAQEMLFMEGQVTELLLVLPDKGLVDQVLPEVQELIAERGGSERYLALSYKDTSDLIPYMEIAKLIYNQIYIFLVLLACIVVINTMIMIVKERTKEIGMMSALGLDSKGILQLFVVEGGLMGIIGSFAGAIAGFVITSILAVKGINLSSATAGFSSDIIFHSILYPVSSLGNTVFAFVLGVVIVTLACIFPARRAAKLEPTEAIREI